MTKQIATTPLIDSDLNNAREEQQLQAQLAQASVLQSDQTSVDRLSTEAADVTTTGLYRQPLAADVAEMLATELKELANSAKDTLPLFEQGGTLSKAGWYEIKDANIDPAHPNERSVWEFSLSLSRAGTRGDSFRAIATNPRAVEHPFGTDSTETVAIPATARKTQWYDPGTKERVPASPASTVATVHQDIDQYDLSDGRAALSTSPDNPALIYDIPYANDVQGVRAYDSRGNAEKTDLDDVRQWQVIHQTGHDIANPVALTTGRLRLGIVETGMERTPGIGAARWDESAGEWADVFVPASTYKPLDLDLVDIGQQRLVAQILFADESVTPADTIALNMALEVGREDALVYLPADSDDETIPQDLQDHLDPIAATTTRDVQATRSLVSRSEVRD